MPTDGQTWQSASRITSLRTHLKSTEFGLDCPSEAWCSYEVLQEYFHHIRRNSFTFLNNTSFLNVHLKSMTVLAKTDRHISTVLFSGLQRRVTVILPTSVSPKHHSACADESQIHQVTVSLVSVPAMTSIFKLRRRNLPSNFLVFPRLSVESRVEYFVLTFR